MIVSCTMSTGNTWVIKIMNMKNKNIKILNTTSPKPAHSLLNNKLVRASIVLLSVLTVLTAILCIKYKPIFVPNNEEVVSYLNNSNVLYKLRGYREYYFVPNYTLIVPFYRQVEPAEIDTSNDEDVKFNNLINKISNIPYVINPDKSIANGASCQTMTLYIEDWCKKNKIKYNVKVINEHTSINVRINNVWKNINFNREGLSYNDL